MGKSKGEPKGVVELRKHVDGNKMDLSVQGRVQLPRHLINFPLVAALDFSSNLLTILPGDADVVLQHIVRLDLSLNAITELPDALCNLVELKSLNLLGNRLTALPKRFGALTALRWLDLKENPLDPALLPLAVVGSCETEGDCRECARRVKAHLLQLEAEESAVLAKRAKKRAKEEARLARRAKEARDAAKEGRRKEWDARRAAEAAAAAEAEAAAAADVEGTRSEGAAAAAAALPTAPAPAPSCGVRLLRALVWAAVLAVAVAVGAAAVQGGEECSGPPSTVSAMRTCISALLRL